MIQLVHCHWTRFLSGIFSSLFSSLIEKAFFIAARRHFYPYDTISRSVLVSETVCLVFFFNAFVCFNIRLSPSVYLLTYAIFLFVLTMENVFFPHVIVLFSHAILIFFKFLNRTFICFIMSVSTAHC